jgi:hypothetical protein
MEQKAWAVLTEKKEKFKEEIDETSLPIMNSPDSDRTPWSSLEVLEIFSTKEDADMRCENLDEEDQYNLRHDVGYPLHTRRVKEVTISW